MSNQEGKAIEKTSEMVPEELTEESLKKVRIWLIQELVKTIKLASQRTHGYCRPKSDKLTWARMHGYHCQILNSVLREAEVDTLQMRLEAIEDAIEESKNKD